MRPIVTALLIIVAYEMAVDAFQIQVPLDYTTILIAVISAAALYYFKIHPVLLIALSMVIGYLIY
ncbi:hypothetical protein [Dehalobacter restrictus]|uniref:hypothetical protein n=1 Tax=Dehalobacter restrictus TaxID=55583 RepID=UPI000B2721C6|nr:hypothetical protein [Dehalobacter restrictus]